MRYHPLILIIGLSLLLACSKTYVCPDGSSVSSKDQCVNYGPSVQDYVLTLEDMPSDYLIDDDETGIQLGSDITESDLARGWKEGYFCGFFRPEGGIVVEGVHCFVSRYDKQGLVGVFDTNESVNLTFFEAPTIGDSSVAYHSYDAASDVSAYNIELIKGDVYAGVTVEKQGQHDLSEDAIRYAQLIASRIR